MPPGPTTNLQKFRQWLVHLLDDLFFYYNGASNNEIRGLFQAVLIIIMKFFKFGEYDALMAKKLTDFLDQERKLPPHAPREDK